MSKTMTRAPDRWCTRVSYFDMETGEELLFDKSFILQNYDVVAKERSTSLKTINFFYYVKKSRQQRIEFEF